MRLVESEAAVGGGKQVDQLLSEAAGVSHVNSNQIRTAGWMLIYVRLVPALDRLVSGGYVPAMEGAVALQWRRLLWRQCRKALQL